jgi:exodeoxyribonuclease-3
VKIATWNVNSLRVRMPHLVQWLAQAQPDVVALQETKVVDESFPAAELAAAGYHAVFSGQKTYNGVAVLSRNPATDVVADLPGRDDPQRRFLACSVDGVRVVNVYVPNGSEVGSDKYAYKLDWLAALRAHLVEALTAHQQLVLLGDFNIAPEDRDVHDPDAWRGRILCSDAERDAFTGLLALPLVDLFRQLSDAGGQWSWWDYRMNAFKRDIGLRIDHILGTDLMRERVAACEIVREPRGWERPSDHAPVMATFND